ncbi:ribosomal protein L7/L12 [Streptomyces sp. NPDC097619]|uniref:ribosomal protein L7/L12 n=1 Tax=Streptomyces sp. NPDC097619 TaxID=3157228 RepID=UPI0033221380
MEEPGFFVQLTHPGDRKTDAVRAVRAVTGLSLWHSKLLLDSTPARVTDPNWLEVAEDAAALLEAAGASTTISCDSCARTFTASARPLDPAPCLTTWPPGTCRVDSPESSSWARALLHRDPPTP